MECLKTTLFLTNHNLVAGPLGAVIQHTAIACELFTCCLDRQAVVEADVFLLVEAMLEKHYI